MEDPYEFEPTVDPKFCDHEDDTKYVVCRLCGISKPPGRGPRIQGFTGPASLVPTIEEFWETGDPEIKGL